MMRTARLALPALLFATICATGQEGKTPATVAQPDARATVCDINAGPQAVIRYGTERDREADRRMFREYTWTDRVVQRELDGDGRIKSTKIKTFENLNIQGEQVRRLVAVDDKPLPEKEKAKQEEKIQKLIREREKESPADKQKRLQKLEQDRAEARRFAQEIAEAFDFKVLPSEQIAGRTTYVVQGDPKPGYKPKIKDAQILSKFRGRIWLDSQTCDMVKIDAEIIDTISFGGFLARVGKGGRFQVEQTRVNDEIFLPSHVSIKVGARVLLLKKLNMEIEQTSSDFRKFRVETQVTDVKEIPPK